MTDPSSRLRAGLREYAESIDVVPPGLRLPLPQRQPARVRRWLTPVLAGAAVLILVVTLGQPWLGRHQPASGGGPGLLPQAFAKYSHLLAPLSQAPLGRSIAAYDYGQGDVPWDWPQSVLLSADRNAYRLVDAAMARGKPGRGGPRLLSGDGTKLAVAVDGPASDILVIDLVTNRVTAHRLGGENLYVTLLAWSPDSRRLAYATRPYQPHPFGASAGPLPRGGVPVVLDVDSGQSKPLAGQGIPVQVAEAAFSWDGALLAVQEGGPGPLVVGASTTNPPQPQWLSQRHPGKELVLVSVASGAVVRTIPVPELYRLAGQQSWSPDGRMIALERDHRPFGDVLSSNRPADSVRYVDANGGPELRQQFDLELLWFLGWRGPDRVLVLRSFDGMSLVETDLNGESPQRLSLLDTQPDDDRHIDSVQLAYLLVPDMAIHDPGDADYGPWPTWLRVITALVPALGLAILGRTLRRRFTM